MPLPLAFKALLYPQLHPDSLSHSELELHGSIDGPFAANDSLKVAMARLSTQSIGRSMTYDVVHGRFPSNGHHVAQRISIFQPAKPGSKCTPVPASPLKAEDLLAFLIPMSTSKPVFRRVALSRPIIHSQIQRRSHFKIMRPIAPRPRRIYISTSNNSSRIFKKILA